MVICALVLRPSVAVGTGGDFVAKVKRGRTTEGVAAPESGAGRAEGESRRAALKRFGRYAVAAPAAIVLLDPRTGHALGSKNKNRNRGGGGHYGLPAKFPT